MLERVFYRPARIVYFTDQNQFFYQKLKYLIEVDNLTKFQVNWTSQSVRTKFGSIHNFWSVKYTQTGGRKKFPRFVLYFHGDSIGKVSEHKNKD